MYFSEFCKWVKKCHNYGHSKVIIPSITKEELTKRHLKVMEDLGLEGYFSEYYNFQSIKFYDGKTVKSKEVAIMKRCREISLRSSNLIYKI